MLTTNDEPNKAMREINAKLGYQTLPGAHPAREAALALKHGPRSDGSNVRGT